MFRDDLNCQGASRILSKLYGSDSPIRVLYEHKTAYVSIYLAIGFSKTTYMMDFSDFMGKLRQIQCSGSI